MPLLVLEGILVGLLAGAVNGLLVSRAGITPILATLGTMQVFNGSRSPGPVAARCTARPKSLANLGMATVAGVPVLFVIFLLVAVVMGLFVARTPAGCAPSSKAPTRWPRASPASTARRC